MTRRSAILASVWVLGLVALAATATIVYAKKSKPLPGPGIGVSMMPDKTFDPQTVTAVPGQRVTWTNKDTVTHSVIPDTGHVKGGPDSHIKHRRGIKPGQSYHWNVPDNATSGTTYYYHDKDYGKPGDGMTLGSGMAGSVTVR